MSLLDVSLVTVALMVWLAVFIGGMVIGMERMDTSLLVGGAILAVCGFLTIGSAVLVAVHLTDDGDGIHRWDGGAGPATVCNFTVDHRLVPVGKVLVHRDQVQTVCKDPE